MAELYRHQAGGSLVPKGERFRIGSEKRGGGGGGGQILSDSGRAGKSRRR